MPPQQVVEALFSGHPSGHPSVIHPVTSILHDVISLLSGAWPLPINL